MTDEGQRKVMAVQKGLRSLLRRTRSRQGRRRISPSFLCVVIAGLLVPSGVAWPAPPPPDPPPPGLLGTPPTSLEPDVQPVPTTSVPRAPAPAQETDSPVAETTEFRSARSTPAPSSTPRTRPAPAGRRFAQSAKLTRRVPDVAEPRASGVSSLLSSDASSRRYLLAALSLAVLVFGSGTLLTVLARLRPVRGGLA